MSYRLTKGITRSTLSKKGISWLDSPSVSTSVPVTWKNLTEISLTGNKLDNGDFSLPVEQLSGIIASLPIFQELLILFDDLLLYLSGYLLLHIIFYLSIFYIKRSKENNIIN